MMKNITVVEPKKLDEQILKTEKCVCFVFTSLGNKEPYIESLEKYLKGEASSAAHALEKEQWFLSVDVANVMRQKAKLFSDFAEANKENKNITFLIMGQTDENHKGSSIYLYQAGSHPNTDFEPLSKPEKITVSDIDCDKVSVEISPPKFGAKNITSYRVEFKVEGEEEWRQITAGSAEVTLKDLELNTEHRVRCRAVTGVGVSPVHELEETVRTLPCSAPRKLQVEVHSTEMSVKWEKPAAVAQNTDMLGYVVEYAQSEDGQALQWKQEYSVVQRLDIPGLQAGTQYAVRVHCDCGFSGRSKDTEIMYVVTTKRQYERTAEYLKNISKEIKSSSYLRSSNCP
ncbi:hypothetical protein WMY93_001619 [Mugilogobius chulae]|uniref:Fibronectin type-III domain-containing protein n=1 Tax=Mugilogobius chulae TaxID=88201 RepID=A0AAW0PSI6_9GOBI